MATLSYQQVAVTGTAVTMAAASAGGDKIAPGGTFIVRNGGGSSITVTIAVPGNTKYGLANPDIATAVAAGAQTHFLLTQPDLGDPTDNGLIAITYSGVTTVTVGATNN